MSKKKLQEIRETWSNKETEGDTSFFNFPYITHDDVVELMKLAYNQALENAGKSMFNMTAYTHRSQDYQHGWEDCQIEAQRKIEKLKK